MNIRGGRVTVFCGVLLCAVVVGCPPKPAHRVSLDEGHDASAAIGSEGGTLEATATDGTVYTLTIPPNALSEPVEFTMTPVTDIRELPLSGGFVGAVDLEPAGVQFARAAKLTIATALAPPAGQIPIGFDYEGDAETLGLALGGSVAGVFTIMVEHFSGAGIGFGTQQDASALSTGSGASPSDPFFNQILGINTPQVPSVTAAMRQWFSTVILPQLENASTDAELAVAVREYVMWSEDVPFLLGIDGPLFDVAFAPERAQAAAAAAPQLRAAIDGNNDLCGSARSFSALANVLFWQTQAVFFGVDTPAEQLDRASVLRDLCVEIVMDPPDLPNNLQEGFPQSLDLRFGVRFKSNANEQGAPFEVDLTATGATLGTPSGSTDANGNFTTVVTATGNGPVTIQGTACLILPGTVTPTDICFPFTINRNGVDLSGTYEGMIGYVDATGSNDYHEYTVVLTQNQNAISGTYEGISQAGNTRISGSITATLTTTDDLPAGWVRLEGLELTQQTPCSATIRSSVPIDGYVGEHHTGIGRVEFDLLSGCPACLGSPPNRFCGTSVWMTLNRYY